MYDVNYLSTYPFFEKQLETFGAVALHDALTGVIARPFILGFVHALIDAGTPFTLAMIDLDNFKDINDNYGHKTGDAVLASVGEKIRAFFGTDGIVGRFGGDEFLTVYLKSNAYDDIHDLFDGLYSRTDGVFRKEMTVNGVTTFVTATVGSASFPDNARDFDTLFSLIDKALYRGKSKGRNCYIIYVESKHASLEIPKMSKRSLYDTFRQLGAAFDEEGSVHEKLAWAFRTIEENLRMHRLLWIDGKYVMHDAQTGDVLGVYPEVAGMVKNSLYAATNFSDMYNYSHALADALKGIGMESALIMQVTHRRRELGYLVVCPEVHTMHLWQDEEIAAIYVLCRMLAQELMKQRK